MASQYPPDTPQPGEVKAEEDRIEHQSVPTDPKFQKPAEQDRKDFVRHIDWASF